ncbi:hypothetical protein JI739_07735 [Ramlibacter sp. AW1]|uniref:Uncharacterized protein n=1 Tax=Ramlibacter aurantiacus TaxID=2801330 RepID=A0A937D6U3_9BURK|nr:hypothetical protein [Ramlibacter aurantiacus]MBL0420231.1 hypothetical protein [Ramlibacter aurantiacus]
MTTIRTSNLLALADLRTGKVDRNAMVVLGAIVGASERLARAGIGLEALAPIAAGKRALAAIAAAGGLAENDAAISAVLEVHAWYESQLDAATPADVARALAPYVRLPR